MLRPDMATAPLAAGPPHNNHYPSAQKRLAPIVPVRGLATGEAGPNVQVVLYAPAGRRAWWHYSYCCPHCRLHQFGRAPDRSAVAGPRRGGCGHQFSITVAQVIGGDL